MVLQQIMTLGFIQCVKYYYFTSLLSLSVASTGLFALSKMEEQFPVPGNAAGSKIGNGVISLLQ